MSPPRSTPPAPPLTPAYAYSSLPSHVQPQSSPTITNPPHPTPTAPTAPPSTPAYADTSLLPQPQASYPNPVSLVMPSTPRASYVPLPPHSPSPNPSPPYSTLTHHSGSHTLVFHPLLRYSQHSGPTLVWDVRTDPTPASLFQVSVPTSHNNTDTPSARPPILISEDELRQPATTPPRRVLRLFCGIVPHTSTWGTITVAASSLQIGILEYVTVLDVLNAVRECMRTPIIQAEWDALCEKQQDRVNEMFDSRWRMSGTPAATRGEGVLRQDCLLLHTLWGGLTSSFVEEDAAILTLRRPVRD